MKLRDYIKKHPRLERMAVRQRIADACNVSEQCIRHYANGNRIVPSRHLAAIVAECGGDVSIEELLPEQSAA